LCKTLEGAKIISYGARVINEGGYQSLPKLTFPGGALIGCSAGFLNVPKIKGSHMAMQSGMNAADAISARMAQDSKAPVDLTGVELTEYEDAMKDSWVYKELKAVRNIHPALKKLGHLYPFMAYFGLEDFITKGRVPWTFRSKLLDWQKTKKLSESKPIEYPKPDGVVSFDLLTNLQRSGTHHNEDQPPHLKIKPGMESVPMEGFRDYGGPEAKFCPARVYEWLQDEQGKPKLQINFSNCVHCKSCDIKPYKNFIRWTVPEGGGGPKYAGM